MKGYWRIGCAMSAGLCLCASMAWANVYPSGVTVDAAALNDVCGTLTVSYVLNENARGDGARPGVTIEVLDGASTAVRTVSIPTQVAGRHAWQWDGRKDDGTPAPAGSYTIRITAADLGHSTTAWTQISPSGGTAQSNPKALPFSFYFPTSVDVNRNPASPYYGRIYVAENNNATDSGSTAFGRVTQSGIYALNADGTEAGFSNAVDGSPGYTMPDWTHDGTVYSSPFRLNVAWDDGHVYVSSFYDDLVFVFPPDLSSCTQLVASDYSNHTRYGETDTADNPLGQWMSSITATGSQAAGDRVLWILNPNYWSAAPNNRGVVKYTLGSESRVPTGDTGTFAFSSGTYYGYDFARDNAGNWYLTNYRSKTGEAQACDKYDPSGTKIGSFVTPKDQAYVRGIGVCGSKGWVAISKRYESTVPIYDSTTGQQLWTVSVEANPGHQVSDVAFDAAGNLYTVANIPEWMRIWSPPQGPNHMDFTTPSFTLNKTSTGGPTITTQPPADVSFCAGGSASISVAATGSGTVTYQWLKDGVPLVDGVNGDGVTVAGATTDTLLLSNVAASYSGAVLSVKVCDDNGVTISQLTILHVGIFITAQPASQTVCHNGDAVFTIAATGSGNLTYQWQKDNSGDGFFNDIPGATGTSLTVTSAQPGQTGTQIRCIVDDECEGTTISNTAVLSVKGPPTSVAVYFPVNVNVGQNAHFYCSAVGTGVLHYQWYKTVRGIKTPIGEDAPTLDYVAQECDNWFEDGAVQKAIISCLVVDDCGGREGNSQGGTVCTLTLTSHIPTEEICGDGLDNDCDGVVDDGCCNEVWADTEGNGQFGVGFGDGDVDQADFGYFQLCFSGKDIPYNPDLELCRCLDRGIDKVGDGDIDLADLDAFLNCAATSGPEIPANCP